MSQPKKETYVIGDSLEAALFAHYNNFSLILNSTRGPFDYDTLGEELPNFSGLNKSVIWSSIIFEMSLAGKVPYGKRVKSIRLTEDSIKVSMGSISSTKDYEKCYIFNEEKTLFPNEIIQSQKDEYKVVDWMNVRSGMLHEHDKIDSEDCLVKEAIFYVSNRIPGNKDKKDVVSISYLDKEQLNSFDYSDTMVKFKLENMMRSSGIKGAICSKDIDGKPKRYSIKIEHSHREVFKVSRHKYRDSKNIKFLDLNVAEIVKKYA